MRNATGESPGEQVVAEIVDAGGEAVVNGADVADWEGAKSLVTTAVDTFGGLHAAFANAGLGLDTPGTVEGDPDEWRNMIDVNIMGLLYTARAAIPHLKKTKGHLVMTGSAAGRRHIPGSIYGATKWFVHGYAGNMAEEMKEWGGRVTVIAPGMVDTAFFSKPKPDKLQPEDVAGAVMHALQADPRCAVREVFLMPQN